MLINYRKFRVFSLKIQYIEQQCKSILHKIQKSNLPFRWGINPYRGCYHSCIYCYARYTHSYLELNPISDFETTIMVKVNAPQILRKEFSKPKWKKEIVNLGSVCDPYQPAEEKYRLSREILKVFLQYKNPITIATKSDLITRDIDLLKELNDETFVNIVVSISSFEEETTKAIEPRAPSTQRRLKAIRKLRDVGLKVGVLAMPIVPFLNDSENILELLFEAIASAGANFVLPGILYLQGPSRERFLEFIKIQYPNLEEDFNNYYRTRSPPTFYREKKRQLFRDLIKRNKLNDYHTMQSHSGDEQLTMENWLKKSKKE